MEITMKWIVNSKSDEEAKKKVKAFLNAAYGDLAVTPLPDWDPEALRAELHKTKERCLQAEMDRQNRDDEILDLKLENDRLKQREEILIKFVKSVICDGTQCSDCVFYQEGCRLITDCKSKFDVLRVLSKYGSNVLEELKTL